MSKPIEQASQQDVVPSRNEKTGKTEYKRVLATTVRKVSTVATVQLADGASGQIVEEITATLEHPFYVAGKGFVEAADLGIGSQVVTRAGPPLVVKNITLKSRREGYTVYNLVVEGDHTYFVGNAYGGVWVHNQEGCPPDLSNLSRRDLNQLIGDEQRGLLKRFLGQGLKGAQNRAADFQLPEGLTRDTLNISKEIAQRAINAGADSTGVQAERLKLIERALGELP